MSDIRRMQLGQLVDFIASYNERNKQTTEQKPKWRKATQADIDAYFG